MQDEVSTEGHKDFAPLRKLDTSTSDIMNIRLLPARPHKQRTSSVALTFSFLFASLFAALVNILYDGKVREANYRRV